MVCPTCNGVFADTYGPDEPCPVCTTPKLGVKLTEEEYIIVANLTRLRAAVALVGQLNSTAHIEQKDIEEVHKRLWEWISRLEGKVHVTTSASSKA